MGLQDTAIEVGLGVAVVLIGAKLLGKSAGGKAPDTTGSATVLSQIPGFVQNPLDLPTADVRLDRLISDWFENAAGWNPFGLGHTGLGAYDPCDYNAFLRSLTPIDRPVAPATPPPSFTSHCPALRGYTTPGGLGY